MEIEESSEDESANNNSSVIKLESSYHNPEDLVQFVISGLSAKGLKKSLFFAPDPYVKFRIGPGYNDHNSIFLPHHGQNCRTTVVENTTEPKWPGQVNFRFKLSFISFEDSSGNEEKFECILENEIKSNPEKKSDFSAIYICGIFIGRSRNRGQRQICQVKAEYFPFSGQAENPTVYSDARANFQVCVHRVNFCNF